MASYRAVPVAIYLGARGLRLKGIRERLEPFGKSFGARRAFQIGARGLGSWCGVGPVVDQLVGEQQTGEQKLASL